MGIVTAMLQLTRSVKCTLPFAKNAAFPALTWKEKIKERAAQAHAERQAERAIWYNHAVSEEAAKGGVVASEEDVRALSELFNVKLTELSLYNTSVSGNKEDLKKSIPGLSIY